MFQKVFSEKKVLHQLGFEFPYLMLESQLLYQLVYRGDVVSNETLLSFFVFNPLQSANQTPNELAVQTKHRMNSW